MRLSGGTCVECKVRGEKRRRAADLSICGPLRCCVQKWLEGNATADDVDGVEELSVEVTESVIDPEAFSGLVLEADAATDTVVFGVVVDFVSATNGISQGRSGLCKPVFESEVDAFVEVDRVGDVGRQIHLTNRLMSSPKITRRAPVIAVAIWAICASNHVRRARST